VESEGLGVVSSGTTLMERVVPDDGMLTSASQRSDEGYPLTVGRICTVTGMLEGSLRAKNRSTLVMNTPFA
ncbi:hypothetical protein U2088_15455, partial [Listeria monocytogenes]|uniref:hypothetical protein n=1 Tax=Listeria monocytogenes TaxID=1639 RepID=UPI002FDC4A62